VGGGVEELVGDAEDATFLHSFQVMPVALLDDSLEGDAVPCPAPGEEEDVGVGFGDDFCGGVSARFTEIFASGGFYQFSYPGLGVDEGLAPLFAVDDRGVGAGGAALARGCDGGLHVGDEGLGFGLRIDYGGDEADVFVDVGEGVRGEGQDWQAGLQDCGERFQAVGDTGKDEVYLCGEDLFGVGGPTVVEDVGVPGG
jgi:hypothetical protein